MSAMKLETLNAQARASLPSPAGRRAGDEGAQLKQTIAGNVAEILET
jgi:hypothetical protein